MAPLGRAFALDVLIKGSGPALAAASRLTGITRTAEANDFSFERIVPRPSDPVATDAARVELLRRFDTEVRRPWEALANEVGLDKVEVQGWGYSMNFHLAHLADALWSLHPDGEQTTYCLLYTSPSPRDRQKSRMPSSA